MATLAIVVCLAMLTQSGGRELRDVAIALAAGLGIYAARRGLRTTRMVRVSPDRTMR